MLAFILVRSPLPIPTNLETLFLLSGMTHLPSSIFSRRAEAETPSAAATSFTASVTVPFFAPSSKFMTFSC
jgi:hypothetical protein